MSNRAEPPADATLTIQPEPLRGGAPARERCYLLVFDGDSSAVQPLPPAGEFVIGRAPETDLQLKDRSASRRHAKLLLGEEIHVVDLQSHNGTLVNGERVAPARALISGDVISICDVNLVFHRDIPAPHLRPVGDPAQLRQRLEEEIARALRYQRLVTLLCLELGAAPADRLRVTAALGAELQPIDVVAWDGGSQLLVLLPELLDAEAEETAHGLLLRLQPLCPQACVGLAACPLDGCDADTILGGARAAARAAGPGQVRGAAQASVSLQVGARAIVVAEPAMVRLYDLIRRFAHSDLPVLIRGETGAGKEIAAAAIHEWSRRQAGPLVALNCAALPEGLVESELFGHEKGAFTGAGHKPGLLKSAAGGTVFLDEIGELPLSAQAKLLRVLETKRAARIGEVREREIDIRVVAASNRDLREEVRRGRFRQDLFFRLDGATLVLPPLRDRRRELPILARTFLRQACERAGRPPLSISAAAMQRLQAHPWPGNLRELRNVMEYAAVAVQGAMLEPWDLEERLDAGSTPGPAAERAPAPGGSPRRFRPLQEELRELERTRIAEAMTAAGNVQARAAEMLGMPVRTLYAKLRQHGLVPIKDETG